MDKQIDCSVTKLIGNLSGDDYIKLKKLNIFEGINFTEKDVYESYQYPEWIKKEDYYSDFGAFIDYLIRRMIANKNSNWNEKYSGYFDKRANLVITSIFLNKKILVITKFVKSIIKELFHVLK